MHNLGSSIAHLLLFLCQTSLFTKAGKRVFSDQGVPSFKKLCPCVGNESAVFNTLLEAKVEQNSIKAFLTLFWFLSHVITPLKGIFIFYFFQSVRPFQPFELKIIVNGLEHALEQTRTLIMQILPGFAISTLILSVVVFPVLRFSEASASSLTEHHNHLFIICLLTFLMPALSFVSSSRTIEFLLYFVLITFERKFTPFLC